MAYIVPIMATKVRKTRSIRGFPSKPWVGKPRLRTRYLFLKEHREAKGLTLAEMAEQLRPPIHEKALSRRETEQWRMDPDKLADAARVLGIEVEDFLRPPGTPSLDAMVANAPEDVRQMAADIVRRLVAKQ